MALDGPTFAPLSWLTRAAIRLLGGGDDGDGNGADEGYRQPPTRSAALAYAAAANGNGTAAAAAPTSDATTEESGAGDDGGGAARGDGVHMESVSAAAAAAAAAAAGRAGFDALQRERLGWAMAFALETRGAVVTVAIGPEETSRTGAAVRAPVARFAVLGPWRSGVAGTLPADPLAQPVELSITRWDSLVDAVRSSAVADGTGTVIASRQLKSSL